MNSTHGKGRGRKAEQQINTHWLPDAIFWLIKDIGPDSLVVELTNQLDKAILLRLAESPFATERTLSTLAFADIREVRQAVADNLHTPYEILVILAHDEDLDVRYQLAENHNLADRILKILADDENPFVSCRAQATLARKNLQDTAELRHGQCDSGCECKNPVCSAA